MGQLRNAAFTRPFRGVRIAPGVVVDHLRRCAALAARMPSGHALSHTTAALLHGIPLPFELETGPLHVTAPSPARGSKAAGTLGHRSLLRDEDVTTVDAIPVTTVERTWCDLAPMVALPDLVAAGDYLLRWTAPATTRELLVEASDRHPSRRGRPTRLAALDLLSAYSESRPESHMRVALVMSPLPDPIPNFPVYLTAARRNIRLDLAYPAYRVGLEYQGDHHRSDRSQWRSDVGRGNDAVDEGWSMLYFTGDDLPDMPALVARVERRLRSRGWPGAPGIV